MSAIPKSNLKRIRDILLADENGINNDVNDNQGSDSDSEFDFLATESDDTSNSEHISEESDLSNSDFEHDDVVTVSQPETLKKERCHMVYVSKLFFEPLFIMYIGIRAYFYYSIEKMHQLLIFDIVLF
ncbi:unnamed protein product [Rotaria socialis]|uniref:Uncharacterized protein n=1 Tax=Rotaria socialis TaxID=392032 RepID=A0A817V1N3_9BILA|nr:unnamed protein product [Rotaria socialis]CAF4519143.1 unnamed protein product [Rotaria socialis]